MERLGTDRRYQSSLPSDPFDDLYRQYGRQNGNPPSTPVVGTAEASPTGDGAHVLALRELSVSIDRLGLRVLALIKELRTEWDGAEEEERTNGVQA